ncbi:ThiF family adenylyltransferase [Tepidicaulis sp. LMO-SS28]|uniref:ThiF family adenylyltransferase n=1 Tax=Tepidicaulis sp. LMO-SS28 TaxID=3447455 RepID=UPI003EE09E96
MNPLDWRLSISGVHHKMLMHHLFPGDGLEAAAILLCGRTHDDRPRLCVRDLITVPHADCERQVSALSWPSGILDTVLERANTEGLSIILIHSHPNGFWGFSEIDNESDRDVVPDLIDELSSPGGVVGTAVAMPDGGVRARLYNADIHPTDICQVQVCGYRISYYFAAETDRSIPLAFTSGMRQELSNLTACVIGVSGTGSIVSEQVARLGFGRVVIIDPDRIELKNLNRILNSRTQDALSGVLKTTRTKEAILTYREDAMVIDLPLPIEEREAILATASADVIFCCVDTAAGRQMCDLIANAFVIPLFDVGVTIPTAQGENGEAEIADVVGRISYIQPGASSLEDRGVYNQRLLRAEELAQTDPEGFERELAEGYIDGFPEEAPSVISLNMRAASAVVLEFIARRYRFRFESNRLYAQTHFSLADMSEEHFPEEKWSARSAKHLLGRGAKEPLLGIPGLGQNKERVQ